MVGHLPFIGTDESEIAAEFLIVELCDFFALLAGIIAVSRKHSLEGLTLLYSIDIDNGGIWIVNTSNPCAFFFFYFLPHWKPPWAPDLSAPTSGLTARSQLTLSFRKI